MRHPFLQKALGVCADGAEKEMEHHLSFGCAVGVAHLAGNASHMAGLVPKAVEYAVCTQGDKNQPDAVLCQLGCALGTIGGAGKQGQLLSAVHQQRLIGF